MKNLTKHCLLITFLALTVASPASSEQDKLPKPLVSKMIEPGDEIDVIAFGSCFAPQFERSDVWSTMAKQSPDITILMGDNVYQSEENLNPELLELKEAYRLLGQDELFKVLRSQTALLTTWDDHDYGLNDAGAELPIKRESEALFEHVWPRPIVGEDVRKARPGVYTSELLGQAGKNIQIIMLDTRFFRSPLKNASPDSTMLGKEQWKWLEEQLKIKSKVKIIVSSIPVITKREKGENWSKLPVERSRLLKLVDAADTDRALLLSGDSHFSSIHSVKTDESGTLWEVTSSSLNFPYPEARREAVKKEVDPTRNGPVTFEANFGHLEIDWDKTTLTVKILDELSILKDSLILGF